MSPTIADMVERSVRILAPTTVALFVVVGIALSEQSLAVAIGAGMATVLLSCLIAMIAPDGWLLAGLLALTGAALAVVCSANPANLGWFGVCVLAGWGAFVAPTVPALALTGVFVTGFAVEWTVLSTDSGWGAWIAGTVFTTVACQLSRRQRHLVLALRQAQYGLAERTRAEERTRIAREMHDVIGHALTVSLLHVSSARLALDDDPAEARASLEEAERLAQQSLAEVRASVGVLREGPASDHSPMPGATDLTELVASFRRAGTPVSYDVVGDVSGLTSTAGLAVYRVLQEALTNVARHAPSGSAAVRVEVRDGARLVVDSTGAPPGPGAADGGCSACASGWRRWAGSSPPGPPMGAGGSRRCCRHERARRRRTGPGTTGR